MLVVVGGHSRKIGKTSVVAGIIAATPEAEWTAVKISANRHRGSPHQSYVLSAETAPAPSSDSARYLNAGALRSFWLRASDAELPNAAPEFLEIVAQSRNVIAESNRVLRYVRPDLYLAVLDFTVEDFKDSSREFLSQADAFVLVERGKADHPWEGIPPNYFRDKTLFRVWPPDFVTPELAAFVRARLAAGDHLRR